MVVRRAAAAAYAYGGSTRIYAGFGGIVANAGYPMRIFAGGLELADPRIYAPWAGRMISICARGQPFDSYVSRRPAATRRRRSGQRPKAGGGGGLWCLAFGTVRRWRTYNIISYLLLVRPQQWARYKIYFAVTCKRSVRNRTRGNSACRKAIPPDMRKHDQCASNNSLQGKCPSKIACKKGDLLGPVSYTHLTLPTKA